ncbi:MAG: hypothetical protein ACKVP0_25310 [Pirellulaceae bacterium]
MIAVGRIRDIAENMEKKVNPYEPSTPLPLVAASDAPLAANDLVLTSYGVLAIAIMIGLLSFSNISSGTWMCSRSIPRFFASEESDPLLVLPMDLVREKPLTEFRQGVTRLVFGLCAGWVVWNCCSLYRRLRTVAKGEATINELIPAQRRCWILGAMFMFLYGVVTFGLYL